jgi:hypothetical protein
MTYHCATSGHGTVASTRLTGLIRTVSRQAAGLSVQRHLVVGHKINTLNNIDFAVQRPVVALGPNTRPYLYAMREQINLQTTMKEVNAPNSQMAYVPHQ